jgi:hypothetical protein
VRNGMMTAATMYKVKSNSYGDGFQGTLKISLQECKEKIKMNKDFKRTLDEYIGNIFIMLFIPLKSSLSAFQRPPSKTNSSSTSTTFRTGYRRFISGVITSSNDFRPLGPYTVNSPTPRSDKDKKTLANPDTLWGARDDTITVDTLLNLMRCSEQIL